MHGMQNGGENHEIGLLKKKYVGSDIEYDSVIRGTVSRKMEAGEFALKMAEFACFSSFH
jgi:hypothetical protein